MVVWLRMPADSERTLSPHTCTHHHSCGASCGFAHTCRHQHIFLQQLAHAQTALLLVVLLMLPPRIAGFGALKGLKPIDLSGLTRLKVSIAPTPCLLPPSVAGTHSSMRGVWVR